VRNERDGVIVDDVRRRCHTPSLQELDELPDVITIRRQGVRRESTLTGYIGKKGLQQEVKCHIQSLSAALSSA